MKDMPQLGMGTFRLEGDEATSAVTSALKVGFRLRNSMITKRTLETPSKQVV